MRLVWLIAVVILAAAGAAVLWPRAPVVDLAEMPPAAAVVGSAPPSGSATPAPSPPATPAPSNALTQLVSAAATTQSPELTPGPAAVIERVDDHTIRLDGRYTVQGSGSEQDPYLVSWELLGSSRGSINAEERRYVLPGRLSSLQDSWVQISGYWAPPLQRFESRDVMLMLNKWDGCCTGLPPTPFDSLEVTLQTPVAITGQHVFRYGTMRGRLRIEPIAAAGFLLGLYRLEDAVLE